MAFFKRRRKIVGSEAELYLRVIAIAETGLKSRQKAFHWPLVCTADP